MRKIITRIAPTPSGYLHIGNIFNFLLTWSIARRNKGEIYLRIDDVDIKRCKIEFIENIFKTIDLLKIDFDGGPSSVSDYLINYRQIDRKEHYRSNLIKMHQSGMKSFYCSCSRQMIIDRGYSTDSYDGFCIPRNLVANERHALRVMTSESDGMKNFIIWQKFDLPSYQLTSVVDDIEMGINFIVRGEDLISSSKAQLFLAKYLSSDFIADVEIIHHPLITDTNGDKLSKSNDSKAFSSKDLTNILQLVARHLRLDFIPASVHDLLK
jgi:glutamyl/glutaminyl-tRNA synthetase